MKFYEEQTYNKYSEYFHLFGNVVVLGAKKANVEKRQMLCLVSGCGAIVKAHQTHHIQQHFSSCHPEIAAWKDISNDYKTNKSIQMKEAFAKKEEGLKGASQKDGRTTESKELKRQSQSTLIDSGFSKKSKFSDENRFSDIFAKACAIGDIPPSWGDNNPGLHLIIQELHGSIPKGISERNIGRKIEEIYKGYQNDRKAMYTRVMEEMEPTKRWLSIQHDSWTKKHGGKDKGMYGMKASTLTLCSKTKSLVLASKLINIVPNHGSHTAANSRGLLESELTSLGLSFENVFQSVSDCTIS